MSAEMSNENVIEFPRPTLVSETPVFDLSAKRQEKLAAENLENAETFEFASSGGCVDGVCVLSWRPRKPHGDVA